MMNTPKGLIERPQFDLEIFKEGAAFHVTKKASNGYTLINSNALVINSTPLYVQMIYVNEGESKTLNVAVEKVMNGEITITPLKKELI